MVFVPDAWWQWPVHGATDPLPVAGAGSPSVQGKRWPSHFTQVRERTPEQAVAELTFLRPSRQAQRRVALGLEAEPCATFVNGCEFVSLGCYCQVTNAIHALGLKESSYPLDWCRSGMRGVVSLLNADFENFLEVGQPRDRGEGGMCYPARWGGSFWHHCVDQEKVRSTFKVRIRRFYGGCEVPPTKPRVFVRVCNSTAELYDARKLLRSLRRAMPDSRVRLLLILDLQTVERMELLHVSQWPEDILIGRISGALFEDTASQWSAERQVERYAEVIAAAARHWSAGCDSREVVELNCPETLMVRAEPYHSGNPCYDTYWPKRLEDHVDMDTDEPPHCEGCVPSFGSLLSLLLLTTLGR